MAGSGAVAAKALRLRKERLDDAYIQIFKKNYVLTAGEPTRNSFASTGEQGSMSIRRPDEEEVRRIIKTYLFSNDRSIPYERLPFQVVSDVLVSKTPLDKNQVFDVLKTHYCYATGGLIVEYHDKEPKKVRTNNYPPHAEIEHVLAWRTMLAIGGGIASNPRIAISANVSYRDGNTLKPADWFDQLVRDATGSIRANKSQNSFETIKAGEINKIENGVLRDLKVKHENMEKSVHDVDQLRALENKIDELNTLVNRQHEEYTYDEYLRLRAEGLQKTDSVRDGAMKSVRQNVPANNELIQVFRRSPDLRQKFLDTIRHYRIDWLLGSQFVGEYSSEILTDMVSRNINIVDLMLNMQKIVTNGMWYSCKSWNQIKSEACLLRIYQRGNDALKFGVYNSGLDVIIRLFLAYIYNSTDRTLDGQPGKQLLPDYEEFKTYSYTTKELKRNIETIYNNGLRRTTQGGKMWDGSSYHGTDEDAGTVFHYLKGNPNKKYEMAPGEFEWLRSIFSGMSYNQAYDHMNKNVRYVLNRICVLLNKYIYERGYFQAKIMETPFYKPTGLDAMGNARVSSTLTTLVTKGSPRSSPKRDTPNSNNKRGRRISPSPRQPSSQHGTEVTSESTDHMDTTDDTSSMSGLRQVYIQKFVEQYPVQEAAAATDSSNGGRKKKTRRKKTRRKRRRKKKKRTRRKK